MMPRNRLTIYTYVACFSQIIPVHAQRAGEVTSLEALLVTPKKLHVNKTVLTKHE